MGPGAGTTVVAMIVVGTVIVLVTVADPPSGILLNFVSAPAKRPTKILVVRRKNRVRISKS